MLFLSCTKEVGFLNTDIQQLSFPVEGGSRTLVVKCDGDWVINVPKDVYWCTASEMHGNGETRISVITASNAGGQKRETTMTISAAGVEDVKVNIVQAGVGSGKPGSDVVSPDPASGISVEPALPNADEACTIRFNPDKSNPLYGHKGELYGHLGIVYDGEWSFVPSDWGTTDEKVHFTLVGDNSWELKLEPSIREYFGSGETPVNMIAIIVRSADGSIKSHPQDQFNSVVDDKYQYAPFVPEPVVFEDMPQGTSYGITYNADNSVTFALYDRTHTSYCYIVGDWNNWERVPEGAMKRDKDDDCWWITLSGFDPDKEYKFQYRVGTDTDSDLRLSDPYTEIVYDQWNDQYIPGCDPFPAGAKALVSAFQINRPEYNWKHKDFKIEDKNDLVIYELLLRDFSKTKNLAGAKAQLDYLQTLGVNAIELMPIQEFDGNLSWGYNPNHYFALDKAYGTREEYKEFIDECHSRGIAVLVDVVFNHLTGISTLVKLGDTTLYNETATHPFSVFSDLNHENPFIRNHIKQSLEYLLTEYDVDGFRFDLSKGLTQTNSGDNVGKWSSYDASRIAILKDYYNTVHSTNPNAVMILEHFADGSEEKELAQAGMQLWRNCNHAYSSVMSGNKEDLSAAYSNQPFGGFVSYMESHDEQRICYGKAVSVESASWGICGTITDWGQSPDIALKKDGGFYSTKSVEFGADDMFKIRGNSTWDDAYNYGASTKGYVLPLNTEYSLTLGSSSQDMAVPAAGSYDIYFSPEAGKVWLMSEGKRPDAPETDDVFATAMRKAGCCAAFFLLVPGPKMIWQFGELGYDISGGNGDTSEKPVMTEEYLSNKSRKDLYDTYCGLLKFRKENPRFFDADASFRWYVSSNDWDYGRFLFSSVDGKNFAVVGNFSSTRKDMTILLPENGEWKDYEAFGSNTYNVTDGKVTFNLKPGEFRLITKF